MCMQGKHKHLTGCFSEKGMTDLNETHYLGSSLNEHSVNCDTRFCVCFHYRSPIICVEMDQLKLFLSFPFYQEILFYQWCQRNLTCIEMFRQEFLLQ
jgi:hypothetical protein